MKLYQVNLPYACFGIEVDEGSVVCARVIDAAPIGRWMIGKSLLEVDQWVRRKRGSVEPVENT